MLSCHVRCGAKDVPSTDGSGCRCTALVMQPQNWEVASANVLRKHQFDRGVACPCSFYSRVRGIRTVVHGDDFMSGGPRHQLIWLEEVTDKHFESKHTVMGASSGPHGRRSCKRSYGRPGDALSWLCRWEPAPRKGRRLSGRCNPPSRRKN